MAVKRLLSVPEVRSAVSKSMARTIPGTTIAEVMDGHPAKVQALIATVHTPAISVPGHCVKSHCFLVPGTVTMVSAVTMEVRRGQEVVTVNVVTIILPGGGLA